MVVHIKSTQVFALIRQLSQITGRGANYISAAAHASSKISPLQGQAAALARPFDASELYGADGLPG
jgi:hypothetical protein